jgi:hypothetical protein
MDDREQLLALHATMVETACGSETKRQGVSIASAGLISAGVAIFAADTGFSFAYLIIPLLIISSIWFVTVRFYQQLAKFKWMVIHEIEKGLIYQPFTREWELYKMKKGAFTFGPSTLEQLIPAIIFVATFTYGFIWLLSQICK